MKKFKVVTLGCRTNQYESGAYTDQLQKMGYLLAKEGEEADLCIVNTCTVTESADSSSRNQIRSLLRENPNAKISVTGCMAESAPDAIISIDSRIKIIPNAQKHELVPLTLPEEENFPEFAIESFEGHTRAFVKVQDGCNSFCTYCIIPYVRGRSRSRPIDEILKEIRSLVASGFKEVVITGINVGDFDGGGKLADLVRAVDSIEDLKRLRISSIDPDEVDDDLTSSVLGGKTTCPSMHIVLQSGSNTILKKMNRKYTRQIFLQTVERLKNLNPNFTFTTDIIVGFPGESESDFEETLDVMRQVKFAKVHMFPYSSRKRTRAALYPNQVPHVVISSRKQILMRLAEQTAFDLREEFLGKTMSVLLENDMDETYITGHTPNFLKVFVPKENLAPNQEIMVLLKENTPLGFIGQVIL